MKRIKFSLMWLLIGTTIGAIWMWHFHCSICDPVSRQAEQYVRSCERSEQAYSNEDPVVAIWVLSEHLSLLNNLWSDDFSSFTHISSEEWLIQKFFVAARLCKLHDSQGNAVMADHFETLANSYLKDGSHGYHSFANRKQMLELIKGSEPGR